MTKIKITALATLLISLSVFAQTYSLKQCIAYAKQNYGSIKIANLNYEVSSKQVKEQIGTALPQIDLNGTFDDNLKISTQLMPGELFGQPGTMVGIKMGTQYNATGWISLSQKIFDPSFWVALKAAKLSETYYKQYVSKSEEQTYFDVSSVFYKVLVAQKKLANYRAMLAASEQTLRATELRQKNGVAKKIDVDKIKVSFNNTRAQLEEAELNYSQELNNLKYAMGMPLEAALVPADSLFDTIPETTPEKLSINQLQFENRIDYQIQKTNVAIQEISRENNVASFLPTLSLSANYKYQGMRSEFDFFQANKDWFASSTVGLTLKIPIFSGFSRLTKVEESDLNIQIAKENLSMSEQSIKVDVSNAEMQYSNALQNIQYEKENLELAESVYKNTQLDFSQGAGSSLDVVQSESSLREAQNSYSSKLLTLSIARLSLEKANGSLINYINNLKY